MRRFYERSKHAYSPAHAKAADRSYALGKRNRDGWLANAA